MIARRRCAVCDEPTSSLVQALDLDGPCCRRFLPHLAAAQLLCVRLEAEHNTLNESNTGEHHG